jgi:hypothetical protein
VSPTTEGVFWLIPASISLLWALFPRKMFRIFEAWRFEDPESVELNEFVLGVRIAVCFVAALAMYALAAWMLFMDGPGLLSARVSTGGAG